MGYGRKKDHHFISLLWPLHEIFIAKIYAIGYGDKIQNFHVICATYHYYFSSFQHITENIFEKNKTNIGIFFYQFSKKTNFQPTYSFYACQNTFSGSLVSFFFIKKKTVFGCTIQDKFQIFKPGLGRTFQRLTMSLQLFPSLILIKKNR